MVLIFTYLKGMLMGIADLVPGVSGGTIALITGIYQRLINAIAAVNLNTIKWFFTGNIKTAWRQVDGWFLLAVFIGIISAIFLFAGLIRHLLANHAVLTWSFFFGLILVSALMLIKQNHPSHWSNSIFLIIGVLIGYLLSTQNLGALPNGYIGIFLAGCIAICAMILPGISGSLILILLGKYVTMVTAVEARDWSTLSLFALGCLTGLLVFSRLLKWLLARHYSATMFALAGLMLGTLFRVWPWHAASVKILPWNHPEPQLGLSITWMLLAGVLVWLLFKLDRKQNH